MDCHCRRAENFKFIRKRRAVEGQRMGVVGALVDRRDSSEAKKLTSTGDKMNRFRKSRIVVATVKYGHFMTGFHCLVNAVKGDLAGAHDV